MPRLPKVKSFYMSTANHPSIRSDYLKQAFSAGLSSACGDNSSTRALGVPELRSCLLSMHDIGTRVHLLSAVTSAENYFGAPRSSLMRSQQPEVQAANLDRDGRLRKQNRRRITRMSPGFEERARFEI